MCPNQQAKNYFYKCDILRKVTFLVTLWELRAILKEIVEIISFQVPQSRPKVYLVTSRVVFLLLLDFANYFHYLVMLY